MSDYSYGEFVITASGYYYRNIDHIEVNDSSIWTRLIQEAGRKCDNYASDLLIDYESYKRDLPKFVKRGDNHEWQFGFRQMGVDGASFVAARKLDGYSYISEFTLALSIDEVQVSRDFVFFNLELRRVA